MGNMWKQENQVNFMISIKINELNRVVETITIINKETLFGHCEVLNRRLVNNEFINSELINYEFVDRI